jgi:flagellar biosynthesis protein FlhF
MKVKKYRGTDYRKILRRMKAEMGEKVVVLYSGMRERRGILRLFGRREYEIVAGSGFRLVKDYETSSVHRVPKTLPDATRQEIQEIKAMLVEIKNRVVHQRLKGCPQELFQEYMLLIQNKVSEDLAMQIIKNVEKSLSPNDLKNPEFVRETMRRIISTIIHCADGIGFRNDQTRVAFVGPTGEGKTTTLAKLAAIYKFKFGKRVAIIANDTYRIAATAQISRIAERLEIPVRIAPNPHDVQRAVQEFKGHQLILLDTAGRSQRHTQRLQELAEILTSFHPHEVHLVISLTNQPDVLLDAIQRFSDHRFDKIIVTKLDEVVKYGVILDVVSRIHHALSFITTGQEIPKDIEIADPDRLARLIIGEESIVT